MYQALIIQNQKAGRLSRKTLAFQAASFLRSKGWEVAVQQPGSSQELFNLTAQAAAKSVEVVVVMGGDGTVNLAAKALAGSSTALAVIPTGTSNVWALEIGMVSRPIPSSKEIWPAIERLAASTKKQVDVGLANGEQFLLWAGVGLDGLAIHHIEPRQRWSKWIAVPHYTAHVLFELIRWRGMACSIELDGTQIESQSTVLVMANASRYLGGMTLLSSQMRLDDGFLDAWLIEGSQPWESFDQAVRLLQNRHHWERVKHIPFQNMRVFAPQPMWLQVDGDPVYQKTWPLEVKVQPRGLWVLIPPQVQ